MKKPYQLRLDEDMIAEVKQLAEKNMRSVNSEFRTLLKNSLSETTKCGIYKITNPDGFYYIGSSRNIVNRFNSHFSKSSNYLLNESFEKFGIENHSYEILEECTIEELRLKELYYLLDIDENLCFNKKDCSAKIYNKVSDSLRKISQVELNELHLNRIREIAIKNDLKTTKQDLVDLGLSISNEIIQWLDKESFSQITNLEK